MLQFLDFILLGLMLVSGLLALARGLTRELLSLLAWGLAAVAGFYAFRQKALVDLVLPHVDPTKPIIAQIIVVVVAFIVVLIVASVVGIKIADRVVDSTTGAFDRTLGLLYGLARGLILVAICYIFYGWLIPIDKQEDWVRNAVSMPVIRWVSNTIVEYLPPDIAETISNSTLTPPSTPPPEQGQLQGYDKNSSGANYSDNQKQGMSNLARDAAQ